jgi:GNAT superfamily N-acetyltransferase
MTITVRMLRSDDDRSEFNSGNIELDRFFQRYAGQNQFKHQIGTTYVAMEHDRVLGYATVSASQIEIDDLPEAKQRRLPKYPLPVLRLARLAVDQRTQGKGIGLLLLKTVFILARKMADSVGCIGVVVDAKTDAVAFYLRYGIVVLEDVSYGQLGDRPQPSPMFLELGAIPVVERTKDR